MNQSVGQTQRDKLCKKLCLLLCTHWEWVKMNRFQWHPPNKSLDARLVRFLSEINLLPDRTGQGALVTDRVGCAETMSGCWTSEVIIGRCSVARVTNRSLRKEPIQCDTSIT